ncbi:helix-turn-helix domain-containing protein [Hydrogenophaga sp. BPS33]|uniref:helix-turn-helix domain-containing protein n=1 Tax=Hydrogenophaga sp. BPS33 TaxID=2651974 RepID=UPI00131FE7E7|nr:helix-turn-helix transcriptional regulator [Hydrogenophaga sp. BPS33]QHE86414.1 helix-turn-helix transcriptional regulator [Hydrogenophaga sp. BPS33]
MGSEPAHTTNLIGKRIRSRREDLGWSQEKLGVLIGIDESSSRARISRYELGNHEPQLGIARNIAKALEVPLAYLYCEENDVAELLLAMQAVKGKRRTALIASWLEQVG